MPIYVYQCRDCGEKLEKLQKISDPVLVDCPACGKPALQKMVTAAGFRLKGSGWYETDFKTEGKRNLAGDQDAGDKDSATDKATADKDSGDSKTGGKSDADSGSKTSKSGDESKSKPKSDHKSDAKSDAKPKTKTKD